VHDHFRLPEYEPLPPPKPRLRWVRDEKYGEWFLVDEYGAEYDPDELEEEDD